MLLPQEVITLPRDEQIILIESTAPIKTKKIFYYEDPFFMARVFNPGNPRKSGPPPAYVPTQEPYDPRKKKKTVKEPEKPKVDETPPSPPPASPEPPVPAPVPPAQAPLIPMPKAPELPPEE